MTEKDEFGFLDEEPESWEAPPESAPGGPGTGPQVTPPGKGSRTRLLLLLLLLVVLGGAGYFFYFGLPEPPAPAPPPVPVKKKPIALPAPPPSAPAPEKVPVAAPAAGKEQPGKAAAVAPAPAAAAPAVSAPTAAKAPAAVKAAPPAAPARKAPVAVATGPYTLQAGAFLLKENLRAAEQKVRLLGYEPRVQTVRRSMPMTRLRVGTFPAEEGQARVQALAPQAPDAFCLRSGEQVTVYAASYYDLDRARIFADRLYEQGIRVEEEPAQVEVTVSMLSFGAFADRTAASEAAAKAKRAGLEVSVGKNP